jgi:hypothetical protein
MSTHPRRSAVAAAIFATLVCSTSLPAQSAKKRTPPATSEAGKQSRKPPAPPAKAVPRPRPPAPTAPPPSRPRSGARAPDRTYIYPFVPFIDFDFAYRFPYGVYPYSRYGYPDYPYRFVFPPPGCVTTELEAHGRVRFDVPQRDAEVFVDGFYAGVVDDFNGVIEGLNLTPGPHHIELHAPGFEPSAFDVNIEAGRTIVYRTPMRIAGPSATPRP